MKEMKKLIIVIILIVILSVIIFFSKDFIIRQYFIYKIENVDYDEYILTTSYNGKKSEIKYYSENYDISRKCTKDGELEDIVVVNDYKKTISYEYNIKDNNYVKNENDFLQTRNLNNINLLSLLNNTEENRRFSYKGIEKVNDRDCYVLFFEKNNNNYTTIYLDKKLLYTVKEEICNIEFSKDIFEYDLDLTLKEKYLFEFDLE